MFGKKLLSLVRNNNIYKSPIWTATMRYCGATIKGELIAEIACAPESTSNKVSVIGVGEVGMATALALLTQNITSHIALVDVNEKKLLAEALDLNHGASFMNNPKIEANTDYEVTKGSRVCIIAAGARQKKGESRLQLLECNAELVKTIVPELVKHSPETILLMISNPVDVLSYLAWKVSELPKNKVIGTGTLLDTARFKHIISGLLGVAPSSCNGMIIGEHGDSSVPVWSKVHIAGMPLRKVHRKVGLEPKSSEECCFDQADMAAWGNVHKKVIAGSNVLQELKGFTSWSIGLCAAHIVKDILRNSYNVLTVSTNAKGYYGFSEDVFLSLPCAVNAEGVSSIVNVKLSEKEFRKLKESASILQKCQCELKL